MSSASGGQTHPQGPRSRFRMAAIWLIAFGICLNVVIRVGAQNAPAPDPAAAARGESLYASTCAFCHGPGGVGTDAAPTLLRGAVMRGDQNGERFKPVLRNGIPGTAMVAFPALKDQDIVDIAAYLHARANAGRGGPRLPETALLVGDAKAGQAYFNGAGKCNTCHSATGDLAHVGTRYSPAALTSVILSPDPKPIPAKVVLRSGETVSGNLDHEDEFVISIVDASGLHHSWQKDSLKSYDAHDPLNGHKLLLRTYTDEDLHNVLSYLVTLK
jgi:cytochrome c oxidase cbb3-type subunit 3